MKSKAKHHAISALLEKPFEFRDKPLIMQYEVTFQNGMDCGGAYVKLLSSAKGMKLDQFHDKTPFTIMFGPDKCGSDVKVSFIIVSHGFLFLIIGLSVVILNIYLNIVVQFLDSFHFPAQKPYKRHILGKA